MTAQGMGSELRSIKGGPKSPPAARGASLTHCHKDPEGHYWKEHTFSLKMSTSEQESSRDAC